MKKLKSMVLGLGALSAMVTATGCVVEECESTYCISEWYYDPWYDCYDSACTEYYPRDQYDDNYYNPFLTFSEKNKPANKDRLKISAAEEKKIIEKGAENINARFGLSTERSFEISKLAMAWKKLPKERQTKAEKENFEKAVLGHTMTEYQAAVASKLMGDGADLKEMLKETAELNGVTPEHLNNIIANEEAVKE